MEIVAKPELKRKVFNHLSDQYKMKEKRTGIHLSTLIYCLTKSFFDQVAPADPTDEEVMLFALGLGLQDVLTPSDAVASVFEVEGVTFSPDFILKLGEGDYCELKTTRVSANKNSFPQEWMPYERSGVELPETWIEYIKGGCFMQGMREYDLAILNMMGAYKPPFPQLHTCSLRFEPEELMENWKYLMGRKEVYEPALKTGVAPTPYQYCKDWECKNCRYKLQCEVIAKYG